MPPAEAMRRVLEAADDVDRAIDARVSPAELGHLRHRLDDSFAAVLDAFGEGDCGGYRRALVEQFSRLTQSLDVFERAAADSR
jgi:hypothetical protein